MSAQTVLTEAGTDGPEWRADLVADGVAVLRGVLDEASCQLLRGAVDRCDASPSRYFRTLSPPGHGRVASDLFRWFDDPDIAHLATAGQLPAVAAAAFGTVREGAVLLEDQYFSSSAGSSTPSPWHQDHPYHPLDRPFLTVWLPLDPVPGDVGIRAVRGSHLGSTYAPIEFSASAATLATSTAALDRVPDVDADRAAFDVFEPDVVPGDAVLLDSRTLHAAGGDCTAQFRRLSVRYAPPRTRFQHRPGPVASFWADLAPRRRDGGPLASETFPIVRSSPQSAPPGDQLSGSGAGRVRKSVDRCQSQ